MDQATARRTRYRKPTAVGAGWRAWSEQTAPNGVAASGYYSWRTDDGVTGWAWPSVVVPDRGGYGVVVWFAWTDPKRWPEAPVTADSLPSVIRAATEDVR